VLDRVADIKVPVLGLYGAADQGIPVADVEKMQTELKQLNKPCEIVLYADTPHGFNADYRPTYRAEQAKDGWRRMKAGSRRTGWLELGMRT
jgi:carboxymethylenebutenolidase